MMIPSWETYGIFSGLLVFYTRSFITKDWTDGSTNVSAK